MARKKTRHITGLDIGTHKVCAIIAEVTDEGRLNVVGAAQTESKGVRKGVVINLEATVDAIRKVVEQAELMAGVEVHEAAVNISGQHIKSLNSRGVIAVSGRTRAIEKEDIRRVIDAAKAVSIPMDRQILHVLAQEYVVDDQEGIGDPTGMTGARLEANVHVVTASSTSTQNTITCLHKAGLEVESTVLAHLSAAEACITTDEKDLGVAVVDIGSGTVNVAIFEKGALWHTAVLPIGGDHFTNDLAIALRTGSTEAEKIKRRHGCALVSLVPEEDMVEVHTVGGRKARMMGRQLVAEVLQARAEELCQIVLAEIRRSGLDQALNSGIVLTGGGAMLEGMVELGEQIFDLPVRLGAPSGVTGLVDVVSSPAHATAVGLVLRTHKSRQGDALRPETRGAFALGKITGRLREMLGF